MMLVTLKKGAIEKESSGEEDKKGTKEAADAQQFANQAIALYKESGDKAGEAKALQGIALARAFGDNYDAALRAANEALGLFQDTTFRKREATALHTIAMWHLAEDEAEEAVDAADEALLIYGDDSKATVGEAAVMQTLVRAYLA